MNEARVLAAHAARPGFTSRGFERSGSYDRLAAAVPVGRMLDLACGDGALLRRLPQAIGVDLSPDELALAPRRVIRARAQALPFAGGSFDVVTCHLAFMLFDDVEQVVAELARVLAPGGTFLAMMGGGPILDPECDDAYGILGDLMRRRGWDPMPLDPRARSERGWSELFAGWNVLPWERCELVLDGTFDEIWAFLSANYEPLESLRDELERRLSPPYRCRAVTWLARAVKR